MTRKAIPKTARPVPARPARRTAEARLPEFLAPWALAGLVGAAGWGAHEAWGTVLPDAAVASAGIALGTVVVALLAWEYAEGRGRVQRWHATVTVALAGTAVVVSMIAGPLAWLEVYVGLAAAVAVSWNVRRFEAVKGDGSDDRNPAQSWKTVLEGSVVGKPKQDGARRTFPGRVLPGGTVKDVQAITEKLDVATNGPVGGHRVITNPERAAEFTLVQMTEDVLRHTIPWPGVAEQALGRSIVDPIPLGLWEDGHEVTYVLPGNHLLVVGMTRAGKSELAKVIAVVVLTRSDVLLWWVDAVKGPQTSRVIRQGADLVIDAKPQAKAFLAALRRLIPVRTRLLGEAGYDKWERGCGMPHIVVWIEEAAEVVSDSDTVVRLCEQALSAGITLILSMQRGTGDNVPTSARANISGGLCFGVRDVIDASMVLSEDVLDAGARPDRWKDEYPGYAYFDAKSIPRERRAQPLRTYLGDGAHLTATIDAGARFRAARLSGEQAEAMGDLYTTYAPARAGVGVPKRDEEADMDVTELDEEWAVPPHPEPDIADGIDPRQPIPEWEGEDIDLADGQFVVPRMTKPEREAAFMKLLVEFAEAGKGKVRMGEIVETWASRYGLDADKQRPRIHEMLNDLAEKGQVARDEDAGRGWWQLLMLVSANGHRE